MLYLLDANCLIDANRDYYPIGRVDQYWEWLFHMGMSGKAKIPHEMYQEIRKGNDALADWVGDAAVQNALELNEEVAIDLIRRVTEEGYAPDLTDTDMEKIGEDPFIVAYALADLDNRAVVTSEASKPTAQRANRRIPDVAAQFGITTFSHYEFNRKENFSTDWRTSH